MISNNGGGVVKSKADKQHLIQIDDDPRISRNLASGGDNNYSVKIQK